MGLFSKENCCLCGSKTGMLDKKCASGKICKGCREKLSLWFEDYKNSTVNDLQAQLAQKEADLERIKTLNFSKFFGEAGVILIDEEARVFTAFASTSPSLFATRKNVSSIEDVMELRPDLIRFDQVEDFEIDINEITHEEKRTVDGKQESYNPPHYTYMESFTLRLKIKDHPFIQSVYVPLCSAAVHIKHVGRRVKTDYGRKLASYLLDLPALVTENQAAVYNNNSLIDLFYHSPYEMPEYSYGFKCTRENWKDIQKYQYYLFMAQQIQNIITG